MAGSYVYIDESGDPGTKLGCSNVFIIAAVVVKEEKREELEETIVKYRKGLGWSDNKELKFNKSGKEAVQLALRATQNCDYKAYAMILNKQELISGKIKIPERDLTALYVISKLLKELYLNNATVVIDGAYGRKYITKARTYLRQQLHIAGINCNAIRFIDSKKSPLIQLADLVAGSVAKSISNESRNPEYLRILGNKLKKIYKI